LCSLALDSASFALHTATKNALHDQTHREFVNRPLQFPERSQLFIRTHDETLFVAMRVSNPDCSPFAV
jgi:hypothetical protein